MSSPKEAQQKPKYQQCPTPASLPVVLRADALGDPRNGRKISCLVGPRLARTLAGTISLSTSNIRMIYPFFGRWGAGNPYYSNLTRTSPDSGHGTSSPYGGP